MKKISKIVLFFFLLPTSGIAQVDPANRKSTLELGEIYKINIVPEDFVSVKPKFDEFQKAVMTKVGPSKISIASMLGGEAQFNGTTPFHVTVSYIDFMNFLKIPHPIIVAYPVIKNGQLDMLFALADSKGRLVKAYFNEPDTSIAGSQKRAFRKMTESYGGEPGLALLPNKFYNDHNEFYSSYIHKGIFLYWFENSDIEFFEFYPSMVIDQTSQRYISITVRAFDRVKQDYVTAQGSLSYFNMTLPCPPPKDCR
jgi:hypothetical protein